ncbi:MAG: cobalt ECF transporter T component CbiQ [Candidatus Omnitrophica bacterium]|nr:cobalt ECF transporter T component CbiQ [Candidatus Omnitrophota bacterium]MDD5574427.1 cobalt ECF transporter T component CbiQ [Candidatus Omnitrophota bacterium]
MHHRFIDEYSHEDSFLCRRDPRIKLFVLGAFVLLVLLKPSGEAAALALYGALLAAVLGLSRLPLRPVALRLLAMLPFVFLTGWSMFAASARPAWPLLAVTMIKAAYVLVAVFLMVATTPFPRLLRAMEWLKVPSVMVRMFAFLYRYIYLILDEFMKMRQAQMSRTVRAEPAPGRRVKVFSSILGHLFVRSYEKGERVYLAMCARGYDGTVRILSQIEATPADYIFLVLAAASFAGVETLCRLP